MKIVVLQCPKCNANIDGDSKMMFCPYCGTKLLLDDETQRKATTNTYHKIDEARIRESEANAKVRLKELEMQERESKRETRRLILIFILGMIFALLMLAWLKYDTDGKLLSVVCAFK